MQLFKRAANWLLKWIHNQIQLKKADALFFGHVLRIIFPGSSFSLISNFSKVCSINFEPPDIDLCSVGHVYPISHGAWII